MSVTICYRPTSQLPFHLGGTSSSLERLHRAIGRTVRPSDVAALRAMSVAAGDEFYNEVADVVEKHGEIDVWGEY